MSGPGAMGALALIQAAWRERWNRRWRFSPARSGLWLALAQLAVAGLVNWRLAGLAIWRLGDSARSGGMQMAVAICLQAGLGSFLAAFLRGRDRLYDARSLALLHVSPVSPAVALLAEAGADLPGRAWSALLWGAVLSSLAAPGTRTRVVLLLFVLAVIVGTLGQLAGTLALVVWVRVAPGALGQLWGVLLGLEMGALGYLGYLLAAGGRLAAVLEVLRGARAPLLGGLAALAVLPGIGMGLWLLLAPERSGDVYREGWLNLRELEQGRVQLKHSRWPVLAPGMAGAVQAKEWLQVARNGLTRVRLVVWGAAVAALFWAGPVLVRVPVHRREAVFLGIGAGLALFAFGEVVASLFSADAHLLPLYSISGVSPRALLAGKALAASPLVLAVMVGTWLAAMAGGAEPPRVAILTLVGGAVGLGMISIMAGLAAAGVASAPEGCAAGSETLSAMLEQVPNGFGGWAGLVLAALFAAAAIVQTTGSSPSPLLIIAVFAIPPVTMVAGYLRLRRFFR